MATKEQNVCLYQGDDVTLSITTTAEENGVDPQDLTGMTLEWAFSSDANAAALVTKTNGNGISVTDAPNGIFEVVIDAEDTETLDPQGYYHEARLTDGNGKTRVIMSGVLTLKSSLTG